jgi:assimilatory nitrate reductase catalytic subunit
MHAHDMAARGIEDGALVRVCNGRGAMTLRARCSSEMREGDVFIPMHWGGRWVAGSGVNALTPRAIDPQSFQPELKFAAVEIEAIALPHTLVAMGVLADADLALEALAALLVRFDYASCGLAGHDYPVTILRAARAAPLVPDLVAEVDAVFGLQAGRASLAYEDPGAGISRVGRWLGHRLVAARLAGDTTGAPWLADWIAEGRPAAPLGFTILAPAREAPGGAAARGKILCTCHDVAESQAQAAFAAGMALEQVRSALRCGTGCGSCVPALKRLEASAGKIAA